MRRVSLASAAALLLTLPACGDLLDPAAAVVHGRKIAIEEVQRQVDEYVASPGYEQLAAQGDAGALQRQYEQDRLTDLIRRAVLEPAAEEHGIQVTEEDVEQRIDEFVDAQFEGQAATFEEALTEQGLTKAQFREIMHDQILNDSLRAEVTAGVEPTEEDIRAFYEENAADYEATRAQHILVEERPLAEQLAARLQGADPSAAEDLFARLAREHSTDRGSRRKGGDLGYAPAGTYVGPFDEAVSELEEGEISAPVNTEFGWHVIRVVDRRVEPFERVRDDIAQQIVGRAQDEAWNEYLRGLFADADVEVNPRYGVFDEELFAVVDPDADDIPAGEAPEATPSPSLPVIPGGPPPG